jgi:hypothetical protein
MSGHTFVNNENEELMCCKLGHKLVPRHQQATFVAHQMDAAWWLHTANMPASDKAPAVIEQCSIVNFQALTADYSV